jgi:hypothetical protein
MAKLASKNQLPLPKAIVEALGNPSDFKLQNHDSVLLLWPGWLVSAADGPVAGDVRQTGRAAGIRKG